MSPSQPSEPTCWLSLAAEDGGHHAAVTVLIDRVLDERVEWFQPETPEAPGTRDALRRWRGPGSGPSYWPLKNALKEARDLGLPHRGHFEGRPGAPEAGQVRAQLLLWRRTHLRGEPIHIGVIARDLDGKSERRAGADQAISSGTWPFCVVLAYPQPESEAWLIAGFKPVNAAERRRLLEQQTRLGFSPVEEPERLTSTNRGGSADAKAILDALTGDDPARKAECLETPLDDLRENGKRCGLAAFLVDVETVVVPLLLQSGPG